MCVCVCVWVCVCLGGGTAGGHTAEMTNLVSALDAARYSPRCYVVAATDAMGATKAKQAEDGLAAALSRNSVPHARTRQQAALAAAAPAPAPMAAHTYCVIPRSREVGQSWFTSVRGSPASSGVPRRSPRFTPS
jgi:beta-1,4-N-acetylglucosaminyltransferase